MVDTGAAPVYALAPRLRPGAIVKVEESGVANHKSAKKRARQDLKRRARNRQVKSGVRTAIKTFRAAADGGDADASGVALRRAESTIRRAATKGVVSRKRASRQVSRLAKANNRTIS